MSEISRWRGARECYSRASSYQNQAVGRGRREGARSAALQAEGSDSGSSQSGPCPDAPAFGTCFPGDPEALPVPVDQAGRTPHRRSPQIWVELAEETLYLIKVKNCVK